MTRAELIRRIAKINGVPDSEAKIFFEILLSLLSKKISAGDKIKIDGGYLQYRKAKVKNLSPGVPKEKEFTIKDVIVFNTGNENSQRDQMLFLVPTVEQEDLYQNPDHHFSLSIGKPVIPLGVKYSEFFIPPSGQELRHLLFSKAERFITNSEIEKATGEETKNFIYTPAAGNQNFQYDRNIKVPDTPAGNQRWGTEDVSRQIEEDSLLDEAGKSIPADNETSVRKFEEQDKKAPEPEETHKADSKNVFPDPGKEEPLKTRSLKDPDKFVRVQGISKKEVDDNKEHRSEKPEGIKNVTPPERDKVESIPRKDFTKELENPLKDKTSLSKEALLAKSERRRQRIREETIPEPEIKSSRGKRTKAIVVVIAVILVLSIGAAALYFSPLFTTDNKPEIISKTEPQVIPVIIGRDYGIPVTYPYDNSVNSADFTFDPINIVSIKKDADIRAQNTPDVVKQDIKTEIIQGTGSAGRVSELTNFVPVKIKENIFRYNNLFVVQVSSWKSKNKAESEVIRFNNMGLKAFMEEAQLSGKGNYYRVRVGNFLTIGEAEDFLRKNI